MSKDHITPAINLQEEELSELSATEFQQRLYGWFEDRGLLAELRAHLRRQMISALKDTAIGRKAMGQQKQAVSPKLQALNLLIAEFLLHQDYHYSLSVFSTEVPLINVLPEFPSLAINFDNRAVLKKWQFSEKDMWDILETLGVMQGSDEGQNIYGSYYDAINKEPLLICIVRMLHSIQNKLRCSHFCQIKEVENKAVPSSSTQLIVDDTEDWMKSVRLILSSHNVSRHSINEILNIIVDVMETERKRLDLEAREKYLKLQMKLKAHAEKQEHELQERVTRLTDTLAIQKAKLENGKRKHQQEIVELKIKLHKHQNILKERCAQVLTRERDIQEREHQLQIKENDAERMQQRLQNDLKSVVQEQVTISELKDLLTHELEDKQMSAKHDAEFLKSLQEECNSMKMQITNTQEAVLSVTNGEIGEHDVDQTLATNLIRELRFENSSLRNVNAEQQRRINELSRRASVLMRDLETTQATVNVLSHNRLLGAGTLSAPPLVAPPGAVVRNGNNSSSGGGEDGAHTFHVAREFRHFPSPRDMKRRSAPRRLAVHSSSTSEENTPSQDVLREARERLRRLERESDEVDRHYQQYQMRRTEEGRFAATSHFQHSPFEQSPWIAFFNREYEPANQWRRECSPTPSPYRNGLQNFCTQADNIAGPSTSRASNRNSPERSPNRHGEIGSRFGPHLAFDAGKKEATNHYTLNKYLKQVNNHKLSQDVRDPDHPIQYEDDMCVNVSKDEEHRKKDDDSLTEQSVASSGVLDMLAAGTSGVSGLSDVQTTEKSESQADSARE